jgi:phosphatidylglycerophosphate synthase
MAWSVDRMPALTIALLAIFVLVDYFDGVIARRTEDDGVGRRLLDTTVDRVSIHALLAVALVVGLLPLWLWVLFVARELVASRLLGRMLTRHGLVIRADSLYRGFNLSIATWGALAAYLSPDARIATFVFVLLMSALALADIIRACLVARDMSVSYHGVVPASAFRCQKVGIHLHWPLPFASRDKRDGP